MYEQPINTSRLTTDDIDYIREALNEAVDAILRTVTKDEMEGVSHFLIDMFVTSKLTYFLVPGNIRTLLDTYMSREPYRHCIEDMTVRFVANLNTSDIIIPRLINTLAAACSVHAKANLLPRDIVNFTVDQEDVRDVLTNNTWLLMLCAYIVYYNTAQLEEAFERAKTSM